MEIITLILDCVRDNFVSEERQGSVLCNDHLNKKQKPILCFMDHTKNLRLYSKHTWKCALMAQLRNL